MRTDVMSKRCIVCIATSTDQAENIVDRLKEVGFPNDSISILFPERERARDLPDEKSTKVLRRALVGGGAGGIFGGALGWLAGIGAVAIPGAGPFVAAGPIATTLSGAAVGAGTGGIAGALAEMGIPEYETRRYEGKIKKGNVLLSVHTEDNLEVDAAKEIFNREMAEDIAVAGEAGV
jgi:hypothetical protein